VIDLARQRKLFLMEAMWTRYFPAVKKVRELLQQGFIGDVRLFQCDFGFLDKGTPRLQELGLGGGALLDIGVYPISFASMVFNGSFPSRIVAVADLSPAHVDEQIGLVLGYKHGQMASIACTFLAETPKEATIVGTRGSIRIHHPFWCPDRITLTRNDDNVHPVEEFNFPLPSVREGHKFYFRNSVGLQFQIQHVHEQLQKGNTESAFQTLDESCTVMRIMDTIRYVILLDQRLE